MVTALVRRSLALAAILFTAAYLAPSWLSQGGLPLAVRLAWAVALLAAARWPWPSLLAFVAGAPLLPIVPSLNGWPAVSLPAMWLFALLLPAWARVLAGQRSHPLPALAWVVLLLASASLAAAMTRFFAGDAEIASVLARWHAFFRDEFTAVPGYRHVFSSFISWGVVAEGVGFGWLLWGFLQARGARGPRQLAIAAVTGAALVSAWGLRQWWTREHLLPFWTEIDPHITRINATFTDVNVLGSYLAGAAVMAVGLAASRPGWTRVLGVGASALVFCAVVCTGSRAAWAALPIGVIVLVVFARRAGAWSPESPEGGARLVRRTGAALAGAVLVSAALTAYATATDARHSQQRSYADAVLHTLNLRVPSDEKLKGRLPLWNAALRMIGERPLSGIGIGRYFKDVSLFADRRDTLIRPQENAHNYFLQLAAETGLPTLAAWLALIATVTLGGRRAARARPEGLAWLRAGGAGAVAAFLATCLTGHPLLLREGQIVFWTMLALASGGAAYWDDAPESRSRRVLAAVLIAVVLWMPWRVAAELERVDLSRMPAGLFEEEIAPDGEPFRWTQARSTIYVPAGTAAVEFSLRSVAPVAQSVRILVNGTPADDLSLHDHAWRRVRYILPKDANGRFHRIVLEVSPVWRPDGENRDLGVMVRGIDWSTR